MIEQPTELILIRHGETDWNAQVRIQGHIDEPLNARGLAQATALGRRFHNERIDAVYSSDLQRAHRTASVLVDGRALEVVVDARLRERHLGVLEGLTRDEAMARFPNAWEVFTARRAEVPLEAGEKLGDFFRRAVQALSELAVRHRGGRVVIVTHGGVLDVARRYATALPLEATRDFPILNASVNTLIVNAAAWKVGTWGDVTHLTEADGAERRHPPFTL
jgi:probable phosphoglycerate mutase